MTGTTTTSSGSNSNSNNNKDDKTAGRVLLPSYVQPQKYDLVVTPNLTAYAFDGIVAIEFLTGDSMNEQESKRIKLHSKELMYRSAEFQTEAGTVVKAEEVSRRVPVRPSLCVFANPRRNDLIIILKLVLLDSGQYEGNDRNLSLSRVNSAVEHHYPHD